MALSTPKLPTEWPGWNPRYLIGRGRPFGRPYDYYFPPNYLPSQYFDVLDAMSNTLISLPSNSDSLMNIVSILTPGAAVAASQASMSLVYMAILRRSGNSASVGYEVSYIASRSPRIGYQIGTHFKHQAYIWVELMVLGSIYNYNSVVWYPNSSVIPRVEYRMNCRFRRFYVINGKLLGYRINPANPAERQFKLFDSTKSPNFTSAPQGTLTVFKSDGASQAFAISSVDSQWWCTASAAAGSPAISVSAGDFYVLSTPWLIEDPQLMFEYGLTTNSDGHYRTDRQVLKTSNNVIGMWLPPEGESTLYIPYVDADQASYMETKINISKDNVTEQELEGISPTIVGTSGDGFDKFNALSPRPSTVRIIFRNESDFSVKHNYMAGNLVGEYLQADGQYYEIVGQTRYDTVEIRNTSVTSDKIFSDVKPTQIAIVQQNFWKMSEIYYQSHKNALGASISSNRSLWQGQVASVSGGKMTWLASMDVNMGTDLRPDERSASGYLTLADRIRGDVTIPGNVVHAYKKGDGWVAVNARSGAQYVCKSFAFSPSSQADFLKVTAEVDGDLSGLVKVGDDMGVAFDTPYDTATGLSRAANFNMDFVGYPALISQGQYRLFIDGWYDTGSYKMATPISTDTEFSLVDWSFGVDSSDSAVGVPFVYVSTKKRLIAVSFVERGPLQRQCVYHTDPYLDALAFRSALPGWKDQLEQRLVKMGESSTVSEGGQIPSHTDHVVTKAMFEFPNTASSGQTVPSYWFYVPGSLNGDVSPFFSVLISGDGGVKTSVSEQYGVSSDGTAVSPVVLPFEYYAPVKGSESGKSASGGTCGARAYFRYSEDSLADCGLTSTDGSKLKTLIEGGTVASGEVAISPTSLEFTNLKKTLKSVNIFDPHPLSEDTLFLLYGQDSPFFYPVAGLAAAAANPSKPSVYLVMTQDAGEVWSSPKYLSLPKPSVEPGITEWGVPQMLIYDFRYAGSLVDNDLSNCWMFGYGYTRDGTKSTDGNLDYLFLGVYRFNLMSVPKDKTYQMKAKETPSLNLADGDVFAYFRPPHLQDGKDSLPFYKMQDFGVAMTGSFPSDYGTPCSEKFVKIAGGSKSGAIIKDLSLVEDVIGVARDDSGEITVFVRDEVNDGVVVLRSSTGGESWSFDESDGKRLVYAKGGRAPHALGDYLFFFDGDSLKCKRLGTTVKGNYSSRQELLDAYPSTLVSVGTPSQRIAATQEKVGEVRVYMTTLGGYLTAKSSSDGGSTWTGLANW